MNRISFPRMLVISLLSFGLTFSSNIQDPPLMTYKVRQLAPGMPNTALGFLTFVGLLVAMVVQPIVGVFSDRARTRLGRRVPFIIGGAVLIAASLFLLAAAPALWVLLMGVLFIQLSSNILQGPWQALIPDLVPEAQRGTASSLKAVMDIIATVAAGAVAGVILGTLGQRLWGGRAVFVAASAPVVVDLVFVTLTAIWAREQPGAASASVTSRSIGTALRNAFSVDFHATPLFGWWFANRVLFWGAFIAINSFLINYLVDGLRMSQAEAQSFYGTLKVILGAAVIVLALVSGWLSDRFGRKPLMLTAGLVAFCGAGLLLVVRDKALLTVAGAVVGMGIGTFLTASWALATDIIPRTEAARYLGIANMATCLGSGLARLAGGVLIDPLNRALGSSSWGYFLLFTLAALSFLASALVILPLPKKSV